MFLAFLTTASLMTTSVFAKTWENISSGEDLTNAFNSDTDPEVIIHLSGSIENLGKLQSKKGQVYTINGTDYVIKSVVYVTGEGNVTVNADIDTTDAHGDGVQVGDSATVTVNGDVTAYNNGVMADGSANVTVTGDVTGGYIGVAAEGNAEVNVDGNVEGGEYGVSASDDATVTVTNDVSGSDGDADILETGGSYSDGGSGVQATDNAEVTVGGDVSGGKGYGNWGYGGNGIEASDEATVTVTGDVTGGDVDTGAQISDNTSYAGDAVRMESTAKVNVGGNATGGSTNGESGVAGDGVYIRLVPVETDEADGAQTESKTAGTLYVEGTIAGGEATGQDGVSGSGIEYWGESESSVLVVGNYYFETEDIPEDVLAMRVAESFYWQGDSMLHSFCQELGYTETEIEDIIQEYSDSLVKLIAQYTGTDESNWNAMREALNALDQESKTAFYADLAARCNSFIGTYAKDAIDKGLKEVVIPTVTTWKVESGGEDAEPVSWAFSENGRERGRISEILNTLHNYIVRVVPGSEGTVTADKLTAKPGETVTITATPKAGYKVSKVFVNGEEITAVNGIYSFIMPEYGGIEISAEFTAETVSKTTGTAVKTGAPKTGDTSTGLLWIVMMAAGLGTAAYVVVTRRKAVR